MLPAMLPSHRYQGFRTAPIPFGWVQTGERWALWYDGRGTAGVEPDGGLGVRLWMESCKFWEVKEIRAANVRQAKRYAARWCAARLYPELPLREAVARLTDSTPIQLPLATARSAADPRATATGLAPGGGRDSGGGANQGSAGATPTAEGDQAKGERSHEGVGRGR